jgi:hypothetical protein
MSQWYVAVLVLQCKIDGVPTGRVDRQIHVINAADHEAAYSKALFLGSRAQHSYPASDGGTVFWEFKGLHELDAILSDTLGDGTEIWNQMSEQDPAELVVDKASLSAFWVEANQDRKVSDILTELTPNTSQERTRDR